MRLYIAGPMSKRPQYNHAAFMAAQKRWYEAHPKDIIRHPFIANNNIWMEHYGKPFDPTCDTCEYGDEKLREMFALDLEYVLRSDALILLPDWRASRGARIEVQTALLFGLRFFDAETLEELFIQCSVDHTHFTVESAPCAPAVEGG